MIADGVETGKLEPDTKGYIRFIPNDDELKSIETYLGDEITRTLDDYQPLFQDAVENVTCYRHLKVTLETGKAILPAPIARIPADHIIANSVTTVLTPRPIVSIDPYFGGEFPVNVPMPEGMPMQGMPIQIKKSADDLARNLEKGLEFKLRERLDFPGKLLKAVRGAVSGCPFWFKICVEEPDRDVMRPAANGIVVDSSDMRFYRQDGEMVLIDVVPYFNFIRPLDIPEDEIDRAPWCAERKTMSPEDLMYEFYEDEFFLIRDEDEAAVLSAIVTDVNSLQQQAIDAMTQKKSPTKQRQVVDRWHVPFYRDAIYKDPETGKKKLKRLNLIGDFHLGAKRLLNCYLNPYEHQSRPYAYCDQMEEGDSTVKILRWHQDVATHTMQAEIKTRFIANNINTWSNSDSDAADYFRKHRTIEPGEHMSVAGELGKDWGVVSLGNTPHDSMLPLWQAIVAEAKAASKVTGIAAGEDLPGRTPAQTMEKALQAGSQETLLWLMRLSRCISKVIRLYLETHRQFQPIGETIPLFNPIDKQVLEIPFRVPQMLDNFRIALTAADQALAQERSNERLAMWKNLVMQDSEFIAKISAALVDPRTTPALMALYEKMIARDQKLLSRMIQLNDTDQDDFDLTPEISAIMKERQAMQAQAQMNPPQPKEPPPPQIKISLSGKLTPEQEAEAAQHVGIGGTSANPATNPGGTVPGPQGPPNAGGPAGVGGQPGNAPGPGPAPQGGVPAPQQPR